MSAEKNPLKTKDPVSRSITKYDYHYTDENKWKSGRYRASKTAYKKALKLNRKDILKFEKLNSLIGCNVEFTIGKKIYIANVVAVSLPDEKVTVYPTGEIHPESKKEFAQVFSSYPFEFNLLIEGRNNFWSSKIENIDFSKTKQNTTTYFKYKDLDSIPNKFM